MNAYPFTHDISGTLHLLFNDANSCLFGVRPCVILRMSTGQVVKIGCTVESPDLARHVIYDRIGRSVIRDQRGDDGPFLLSYKFQTPTTCSAKETQSDHSSSKGRL